MLQYLVGWSVLRQLVDGTELGPLDPLQVFGIWLRGDYRLPPAAGSGISNLDLTYVLIGIAVVAR